MPTVDTARHERCPYGRGYLFKHLQRSAPASFPDLRHPL